MALRRLEPPARPSAEAVPPAQPGEQPWHSDLRRLEERLDHLEAAFEGLQDAVHRDSERWQREIAQLRGQVKPDAMARALGDDARRRGI